MYQRDIIEELGEVGRSTDRDYASRVLRNRAQARAWRDVIHFRQHDAVMTAGTDGRTVFVDTPL